MRILARVRDEEFRRTLEQVAARLDAELLTTPDLDAPGALDALRAHPDILMTEIAPGDELARIAAEARRAGAALVVACHEPADCQSAALAEAQEWILLPAGALEIEARLINARQRAEAVTLPRAAAETAELLRYQELLYDRITGFPTLPVMIERGRELLARRGELTILYIHFVWYAKIEEIYGWQRLDALMETTAAAVREFQRREHHREDLTMVAHSADNDLIVFTQMPAASELVGRRITALSRRLESVVRERIAERHGEDLATLGSIYVGAATVFRNPKIRTERLIYRGVREAVEAARGAEQWERARKVTGLKATLRDGSVFIEYHPILVTRTEEIYGYEALARGVRSELRSPEVLFEVAEEANLVWELSRLLRRRAVQGIAGTLEPGQYLFLNVDPHEFDDPSFRNLDPEEMGIEDPSHVVLEITERTAIKDYPRFQEYLAAFRELGFRFAVDDAGSGYAGLGSIANLDPDYIKLDISLISGIDSNFLKQNLVETMVSFAENQGAQVIAEGVERREEFETVRQLGVHLTQGFLFYRPKYAWLPAA